jgi:PAS domain S-box-containing protein
MVIVDSSGNIVHCNKALEKLFGYRDSELASAGLDSLLPKRFRQKHAKHREHFFSKAAIRPMSTGLDLYGCRKDSTEFPVEITLHPFETEDGILVYATVRDVSALKRTQDLLAAAIEGMPEGFAYFDKDDRLAVFNQRFIQFYPLVEDVVKIGTPYEVVLRTGIERGQFVAPKGRKEELFKERLAHHRDPKGAVEFIMPDDRCIRVEERKLPGGGIVGIRTDVTDEKNIERELQSQRDELAIKNAELEAYDHTIAHSLKTPLSASLHFLEILSEFKADNLSEEQHQLLSQAQTTLENTGEIVDALLMLSTVSNQQVESRPLDMKRLVQEALRQLATERLSAQATVQMPGTWLPAAGHAPWVGEVWLNYLSNAFKYCEPPVKLELGCSKEGPGSVRYWVQDNGNPLTQEEREQLFVPFSRLHHGRIDGHGLGLTIVQRIVGKLGGIAGVETPDSGGNRFFFTLPLVRDIPIK